MKILVTGAGRGGTNLAIELINNTKQFNVTNNVEDRNFFNRGTLPNNYATKLATENKGFNFENIDNIFKKNPDLKILFVVRNPIDNSLSKIVRGQPKSKGGDSIYEEVAPDGTLEGAIKSLKHMFSIYSYLNDNYSNRIVLFKMEDLINEPKKTAKKICDDLGIKYDDKILNFHKTNRNKYQKKRYGNSLIKNVDLYKDLNNNFNGFFKDKINYVSILNEKLSDLIKSFNY